ncbi:hypothetical protein DEI81_05740 [Curtobacterium sp. MCBD17_013]|uniref:hypothetical protein n=1 Tax=Curtobacterium sp. MCBD17_013 TaxID=2175668 RepID=UPI000DAA80C8|nr:hypothetical protein [Curtobacterium sp. MCBD17_013]PZF64450.1 hypothetical protein DEI81_05740 [Curtobacterium sp. MCBD17_013]
MLRNRTVHPVVVAIGAVALWAVGTLVAWFRLTPESRGTLWAEDGRFFLQDLFTHGTVGSLLVPYQGYLHVVPRAVIALAEHVASPGRFAEVDTALCCAVAAAAGAGVFVLSGAVVRSWVARVLLGLVPVLLPLAPIEISGNAANIHSYLLFLAPWVFGVVVRSWWHSGVLAVVAVLIGLSEIQSIAFLPVLLVGIRSRRKWPVVAGAVIGTGAQVLTTLSNARTASEHVPVSVADMVVGYLLEVVGGAATWNIADVGTEAAIHGFVVLVVPALLVLALLVLGVVLGGWWQRGAIVVLLYGSLLVWAGSVYLNANTVYEYAEYTTAQLRTVWTIRYGAPSSMFLLAAVLVAADVLAARAVAARRRVLRVGLLAVAGVVAAAVAVAFALNAPVDGQKREAGPLWSDQVTAWTAECDVRPAQPARLLEAPTGWVAAVPCTWLEH